MALLASRPKRSSDRLAPEANWLDDAEHAVLQTDDREVVVDFSDVEVIRSADLAELIRLAKLAPSSFNMQNYRFVLVRDPELRKQIRAVAWDQAQVTDASLLVIMCADQEAYRKKP